MTDEPRVPAAYPIGSAGDRPEWKVARLRTPEEDAAVRERAWNRAIRVWVTDAAPDNPAEELSRGEPCPACDEPALRRWLGGFPDEPPAQPHAECGACGYTD